MEPLLRSLPGVDTVLADPRVAALPRGLATPLVREVLHALRDGIRAGTVHELPDIPERVVQQAAEVLRGKLRPVINATGVVLHTNLGRAPWAPEAVERAMAVAQGYCNLELDLAEGSRGGRLLGVQALLGRLVGAEDALVVNNNAAAVLLALTAHAAGREVVVSRGELVEIGGAFRIPEVIAAGGARLVEVGTTNRVRLSDFEQAAGEQTGVLLRVHTSNYRVVGFTEGVPRSALVTLARRLGLQVFEDLGSGSLDGASGEPSVREALADGVDLALFSGDKLLGGPQCGVAVGSRASLDPMRRHPLYRALRVDKVTLAALEATLALHLAERPTPLLAMLEATPAELAARADALVRALAAQGVASSRQADVGYVGGGALPEQALPAEVVVVHHDRPERLARALRHGDPPVVARVSEGTLRLDPRTVREEEVNTLAVCVARATRIG